MAPTYLEVAARELRRLQALAEAAMEQVDDASFAASPGPDENALAILVKHLAGNMRSRFHDFLTSDGEKPDRDRDREFELVAGDDREALMARWREGWATVLGAIEALEAEDLGRTVTIRGETLTVLGAIARQHSHASYHVGQVVQLARHHAGAGWRSLSIPRGQSAAFNADRRPYRG